MPARSKMVALCEPHLMTGGRGQAGDEGEGNSNASRTRGGKTAAQATCPSSFPFPGIVESRIVGLLQERKNGEMKGRRHE